MKILCPECQQSVSLEEGTRLLQCPHCGLETPVSGLGTEPGVPSMVAVRDLSGEILGDYKLTSLVGAGGMGVVYRAQNTKSSETVAVKVLNPDHQWKKEAFVQRFEREVKALRRLEHPGIVKLFDSGEENGLHFLVTEFVDGPNLADALREGPMAMDDIVRVMTQVCEALTFAHKQGIVHRDIKPANIILASGQAKILDFGLAQVTGGETKLTTLTRTNVAMGTFNYLAPEQRISAKTVDHRADIFSLGVVFYEMLTGTLPLGSFAPPSRLRNEAPKSCDRIVTRSLQSSPELRYPDAHALSDDLYHVLKRPSRKLPLAAAVVALFITLGAAAALLRSGTESIDSELRSKDDAVQINLDAKSSGLQVKSNTEIKRSASAEQQVTPPPTQASAQMQVLDTTNGLEDDLAPLATKDNAPAEPESELPKSNTKTRRARSKKKPSAKSQIDKLELEPPQKSKEPPTQSKVDLQIKTSSSKLPAKPSPKSSKAELKKKSKSPKAKAPKSSFNSFDSLDIK